MNMGMKGIIGGHYVDNLLDGSEKELLMCYKNNT